MKAVTIPLECEGLLACDRRIRLDLVERHRIARDGHDRPGGTGLGRPAIDRRELHVLARSKTESEGHVLLEAERGGNAGA